MYIYAHICTHSMLYSWGVCLGGWGDDYKGSVDPCCALLTFSHLELFHWFSNRLLTVSCVYVTTFGLWFVVEIMEIVYCRNLEQQVYYHNNCCDINCSFCFKSSFGNLALNCDFEELKLETFTIIDIALDPSCLHFRRESAAVADYLNWCRQIIGQALQFLQQLLSRSSRYQSYLFTDLFYYAAVVIRLLKFKEPYIPSLAIY